MKYVQTLKVLMGRGEQRGGKTKQRSRYIFFPLFHLTSVVVCYVNTLIGWEAYNAVCAFDVRSMCTRTKMAPGMAKWDARSDLRPGLRCLWPGLWITITMIGHFYWKNLLDAYLEWKKKYNKLVLKVIRKEILIWW